MSVAEQVRTDNAGVQATGNGLRGRRTFRADIQALRALAVTLVVLNHLWPGRMTGGYVGVDVFFVISGFLITSHLHKELEASGRIRLGQFYARRIRRLLPAALLVLAVGLGASWMFLPNSRWTDTALEVLASTFYVENWALAAKSINYSASTASATVAQHYWSLSVEEQFYLLWPLLLLGLFWIAARRRIPARRVLVAGVSAVIITGLTASVFTTQATPSQAYFVTPVRAWEFGAGALVALGLGRVLLGTTAAKCLGLLGLLAIVVSALAFDSETQFPGWLAALPVAGTSLVILAGNGGRRPVLRRLVGSLPVQHIGSISYSLYLWHWPVIVLSPFILGRTPTGVDKTLILALALVLASATKVLVEDRAQASRFLNTSALRTVTAMSVAMVLLAGLCFAQVRAYEQQSARDDQAAAAAALDPCHGPAALLPKTSCEGKFGPAASTGSPNAKKYWTVPPECGSAREELMSSDKKTHYVCDFSAGKRNPSIVWLVGDSHGQHWQGAVFAAAKKRHWIVKTAFTGGCPVADVQFVGYDGHTERGPAQKCMDWSRRVTAAVATDSPAAVFTSMFSREQHVDDGSGRPEAEQFAAGLHKTWQKWTATGARVYVLADPPLNGAVRDADCTLIHAANPAECAVSRSVAQPPDPLVEAANSANDRNVRLLDLTDYFCNAEKCFTVLGGVEVYYDANHMNREYSDLLGPILLDKMGSGVP
ncbi:acyltransferase family protein [Arthrobacter sp. Soil763]|uniref:acyltransferase family protein n=1 Tax=Arthrobacter sp. Soil763 TaxID=1736402 RepID=UPI0009EB9B4A|nr:acyltransferase family protein [Arthrobacter sp. Soil763]